MTRFKGSAEYSVDSKGRLAIPAKMRAAMSPEAGGRFTITSGLDRCIQLFPANEWAKKEEEMALLNQYRTEVRAAIRLMLANADDADLDGQGRVMLPKAHLEAAGINGTALVVGMLDHLEIWNPDAFREHLNQKSAEAETLVERVMGGM